MMCQCLPHAKCKVSFKNRYRKMWDILPILLSIYNATVIPYQMGFGPLLTDDLVGKIIDYIIDIVFLIDLLLMFRTTQLDCKGFEVTDNYEIFAIYVRTWRFKFDVLAMLGNGLFTLMSPSLKYF